MKYIFVTGGVVSSLGKGLAAASIGTLLEHCGLEVTMGGGAVAWIAGALAVPGTKGSHWVGKQEI